MKKKFVFLAAMALSVQPPVQAGGTMLKDLLTFPTLQQRVSWMG